MQLKLKYIGHNFYVANYLITLSVAMLVIKANKRGGPQKKQASKRAKATTSHARITRVTRELVQQFCHHPARPQFVHKYMVHRVEMG